MKSVVLLLILLFGITAEAATISGYVIDARSGETIIGVDVLIKDTDLGSSTDMNGFFVIRGISPGTVQLLFSHVAYRDTLKTVQLGEDDIFLGSIPLITEPIRGEAIEVSANRGHIVQPEMDIAGFQVDPVVLAEVPQLNKDVFQLVKYSPSVTISDALSPLYYVRGGDSGENLVQLDGMTIYNPQHTLSMQAIFNPYAIKDIEMLVGGFDAEYGGRNSSILYIASREGSREKVQGDFRPSTSGVVGAVEFPVRGPATAMVSGRLFSSLTDRVLMGISNLMADFNGSYQTTIRKTRLRVSLFYARDYMNYDFARFSLYFDDPLLRKMKVGFLTNTSNAAVGVKTRSILTPNLVLESHLYYSGFRVDNTNFVKFSLPDTVSNIDMDLDYRTRIKNQVSDVTYRMNLAYFLWGHQTLKVGMEVNDYGFFNDTGALLENDAMGTLKSNLFASWVQDQFDWGKLHFKAGVRSSRFTPEFRWRPEPRVSLVYDLPGAALKIAWGRYHQYITAMNTQDYELSQFLDYYYPLQNLEPLTSIHHIIGLEGRINEKISYSFTTYYKKLTTLYRFDYNNTARSIYAYQASLERGHGEAVGAELLFRGTWKRLSGWVGYSISRSTRSFPSIQGGEPYYYDGDQTHNVKAVVLYNLTKDITGSATLQLTSGFPKTWETGQLMHYSYNPRENTPGAFPVYLTPVKNNKRFPPRLVLDLGWKKKLRSGFGYRLAEYIGSDEAYFTLTIQNLLFLWRNPWEYFYIPDYGYYGLDLFPLPIITAGYSIKF